MDHWDSVPFDLQVHIHVRLLTGFSCMHPTCWAISKLKCISMSCDRGGKQEPMGGTCRTPSVVKVTFSTSLEVSMAFL